MKTKKKKTHHSRPHIDGSILRATERRYRQAAEKTMTQEMQHIFWLWAVSTAETFHAGPERMRRMLDTLTQNEKELAQLVAENGETYAFERLRERAAKVTGIEITHWFGEEAEQDLRREEKRG